MITQVIKSLNIDKCIYCGREIKKEQWKSEHIGQIHYKTAKCSCGKELRVEVDFIGSGHDNWQEDNIEKIIEC